MIEAGPARRLAAIATALVTLAALVAGSAWGYVGWIASRPPTPRGPSRAEPRADDPEWMRHHRDLVAEARRGRARVLFLGDSITRGWLGSGRDPYDGDGLELWRSRFEPWGAANFGVGSDRVEHLLWRVRNGELPRAGAEAVVLLIGTNNIGLDPPEAIAEGVAEVVAEVRRRLPRARVLLLGVLPRGESPRASTTGDRVRPDPRVARVNRLLEPLGKLDGVTFLDLGPHLLDEEGMIPRSVMPDALHLGRIGYQRWAEAMEPILRGWLDEG